ncbi:Uncharacterised protein [Mycobacteroides abscessus]|nr:hypothetical protein [Mycobacteroides abscessus]ESV60397.1 hypothetical protein L830_1069 [Mycobacteroides abscessus MAB_082312_2258]AIC72124.1 hypothetical protein MYCMA_08690 [Mycobacteroides abscessus subsp. massiliense str. GO 06]EIU62108.1 hypothetical protein MM1S1510930_2438 [Mycobacteroides abscessus subsp. bolletii 1S-151-0930]EIV11556.1 hypothetical protein MM2B0912R_2752 [Mycobacteroides abscessus subsp. bolletii 2B-0912-R]EIV19615.1 hypothetical protein MM2B0912S_2357 [Mycobacte
MRESLRDSASAATESATDVAPDRSRRLGLRGIIVVTVVLILVVGASMRMYLLHRNSNYTEDFGAVIDFASFFIAETIISIALIASVVIGYRFQMANELDQPDTRRSPGDATD